MSAPKQFLSLLKSFLKDISPMENCEKFQIVHHLQVTSLPAMASWVLAELVILLSQ
jgi:hypothetical protein